MDDLQLSQIRSLSEPILAQVSAELVELTCRRQGRQLVVRFLIDKVGGVAIHDCARLNRLIGEALDQANCIEESYTLEVSSPGLDRPLVTKRDFERALGEQIEVEVREPIQGAKEIAGQLLAVQEAAIVVTTQWGNLTIPLNHIQRALKAIRWSL